MAKIEKAKKTFAIFALSLLVLSQPGVTTLWEQLPARAQETNDSEASSAAAEAQVSSFLNSPAVARCTNPDTPTPTTGDGGDFTWQIICGEPGTNRNLACEGSCQPCFSDTYYFWRKYHLKEIGYYYVNGNGNREKVPFATGENICRDGSSPTSGAGTVPDGISPVGQYTTWTIYDIDATRYTLFSDYPGEIVCPMGNGRTDYYWDDHGNPGTNNDGHVIFNYTPTPVHQCSDGLDNDGDGATDYPNDFSCTSATDDDETNTKAQCQDGIDNDGDGLTDYPSDPGCSSKQDNDEHNICPAATQTSTCRCATNSDCTNPDTCQSGYCRPVTYQCNDGIDNDNDGATDYPNDFSCTSATDNDETNPKSQCQDGIDNDGNGYTDYPSDTGCTSKQDNTESGGQARPQCSDGIDNDQDGATDYPNDFSCSSATDNDETNPKAQCQDGIDNDGNGYTDYPSDTGCTSKQDNTESGGQARPQCSDGIDNDNDGATDYPNDFSCSSATDNDETNPKAQCQDGTDNDGDGVTDGQDPGCSGNQDNDEHNICPAATQSSTCRCATNSDCTNPDTCQNGYCRPNGVDLSIAKTGPSSVVAGNVASYTITVTNAGPNTAWSVVVSDVVPSGLTFNTGASSALCAVSGNTVTCSNFSLGMNATKTLTVAFSVPSTLACGGSHVITNQATVTSSSQETNSSNNTSQTVTTPVQCPTYQCNDGIDNDNDGATDYPNDFSCSSPTDNDETNPKAACQDGMDNDGDGRIDYPADPGCTSKQDDSEAGEPQCEDGFDNDGDGATDYPNDFSCSSPTDDNELSPLAQCQDGTDNDGDGLTDYPSDPGCSSKQDNDEHNICPAATQTSTCRCATNSDCTNPDTCQSGYCRPVVYQCSDGIDNDNDGATDYPNDFSCSSPTDNDETNPKAACQDGMDNDGDGLTDYPNDSGCSSKQDNDEYNVILTPDVDSEIRSDDCGAREHRELHADRDQCGISHSHERRGGGCDPCRFDLQQRTLLFELCAEWRGNECALQ